VKDVKDAKEGSDLDQLRLVDPLVRSVYALVTEGHKDQSFTRRTAHFTLHIATARPELLVRKAL